MEGLPALGKTEMKGGGDSEEVDSAYSLPRGGLHVLRCRLPTEGRGEEAGTRGRACCSGA